MSYNDPDSGLNRGKIIKLNDLNPEVTVNFPPHGFPLQDADIGNMSASKLLGGAANQFIRWVAGVATWYTLVKADITALLVAADIFGIMGYTPTNPANYDTANNPPTLDGAGHIKRTELNLASADVTGALGYTPENPANKDVASGYKGLDVNSNLSMVALASDILMGQGLALNAVKGFIRIPTCAGVPTGAPTNGNGSLIYDTTDNILYVYNGGWTQIGGGGGTSDIQYLKTLVDAGNLVTAQGTVTATGVICSYTPANGKSFYLLAAGSTIYATGATTVQFYGEVTLRNNTVVVETTGTIDNFPSTTTNHSSQSKSQFVLKSDKLVGNGAKTYDVNCVQIPTGGKIAAIIEGYIQ